MDEVTEDLVNSRKVSYLAKLVGRKKPGAKSPEIDHNSDFEDVEDGASESTITELLNFLLMSTPIVADDYVSVTTEDQKDVENEILRIYQGMIESGDSGTNNSSLDKKIHRAYIMKSLFKPLPYYFQSLDANHGWMLYWLLNAYRVISLEDDVESQIKTLVSHKIGRNVIDLGRGGIAGGAHQIGHAAATYASVLSLVLAEDFAKLGEIRNNLYQWFLSLKKKDGSFSMHRNGESDTRSTYSILLVASLLNLMTEELTQGTLEWLNRCQTYEGGFSGIPDTEAHGGYTFCALASYFLLLSPFNGDLNQQLAKQFDLEKLVEWCVMRQYQTEGGLSGRTNKLVDVCYSFWVGATFPMIEMALQTTFGIFDRQALQCYILNCCQNTSTGGFKDKPGKPVDFYHTNYALCGLSVTENFYHIDFGVSPLDTFAFNILAVAVDESSSCCNSINPIFGLPMGLPEKCLKHFRGLV